MGKDKLKGEISKLDGRDVGLRVEGEDSEELGVNLFKMHCVHFSKKLFSFFFLKKEFALQTLEVFCPLGSESLQLRAKRLLACCF